MDIHYEAQPSSVYTKLQSGCSVTGLYHRTAQLASRTFIRPKNHTTYLADYVDGHVRTNISENSPLQS